MTENTKPLETFEEFRKSFFYGSRSDMSFKFLDHLSDKQGADFLQKLFRDVITSIDTGNTDLLKHTILEGQSAAHAHPDTFSYSEGAFTPFTVNPADAKFTMLTSSGHYPAYNDPEPLGVQEMSQSEAERRIFDFLKEKPVLSEIPFSISPDQLRVRHGGYDIRASLEDPNVTFPWQRMNELQEDGVIGQLTENSYSFIGACSQKRLMKDVIPEWIRLMKDNEVDGAILIPVWPVCHMSVGHIARGFEESGISTVVIAVEPFSKRLEIMSLPRTLLTDNLIGRVLGPPHDTSYQRKILEKAVKLLSSTDRNGAVEHI